jgi:hypothetical protein
MVDYQVSLWKLTCEGFSQEALGRIQNFAQVTKALVDKELYETAEHKQFRAKLGKVLPTFEKTLADIQTQFSKLEEGHRGSKKSRLFESTQGAESQPSEVSSHFPGSTTTLAMGPGQDASAVPASTVQNQSTALGRLLLPFHHRLSGFTNRSPSAAPVDRQEMDIKEE